MDTAVIQVRIIGDKENKCFPTFSSMFPQRVLIIPLSYPLKCPPFSFAILNKESHPAAHSHGRHSRQLIILPRSTTCLFGEWVSMWSNSWRIFVYLFLFFTLKKKKRRRSQNTTHESGDNMQWGGHSPAVTVDSKPAKKLKYQFWHRKPRLKDIRPKCLYNRGMSARKAVSLWPPNHGAQRPLHAGVALKMIRLYFSKSFCLNECSVHATWVDHTWGFLCG